MRRKHPSNVKQPASVSPSHTPPRSPTPRPPTVSPSNKQLYIARLQSRILELEQTNETQLAQITVLQQQSRYLQSICKKQQARLSQELVVEELTREVEELRKDRARVMQVMEELVAEREKDATRCREEKGFLEDAVKKLREDNRKLADRVQELVGVVQEQERLRQDNTRLVFQNQRLEEQIYDKRNIERKFRISLQQIARLEGKTIVK